MGVLLAIIAGDSTGHIKRSLWDFFAEDVAKYVYIDPLPKVHPRRNQQPFERELMIKKLLDEWVGERAHGSESSTTHHLAVRIVSQVFWAEVMGTKQRRSQDVQDAYKGSSD